MSLRTMDITSKFALTPTILRVMLAVWGCVLISDYNNKLGIIPIVIAIVLSIVQIVAGFVLHIKKSDN